MPRAGGLGACGPVAMLVFIASAELPEVRAQSPIAFLQRYCIKCHGGDAREGRRRFDRLDGTISTPIAAATWREILAQLRAAEMPPEDQQQPTEADRRALTEWITARLEVAAGNGSRTSLRRLSHREYRHTLPDLLHLDSASYDPTDGLPHDPEVDGFDNNAAALVLSDYLLEGYIEAAATAIEKAVAFGARSAPARIVVAPREFAAPWGFDYVWGWLYSCRDYAEIGHGGWRQRRLAPRMDRGVPRDGKYRIAITVEAVGRDNPYGQDYFLHDLTEPMRLAVAVSDCTDNTHVAGNSSERHVETIELEDEVRRTYEVEAWMDRGFTPVFAWVNGPPARRFRRKMRAILSDFHPDVAVNNVGGRLELPHAPGSPRLEEAYRGPRIRIYRVEITELVERQWPPHRAIFGADSEAPEAIDIAETFRSFAARAFRRPVTAAEVAKYVALAEARVAAGDDLASAIKVGLIAILASPSFLYHVEPAGDLDDHALAARLSFFLWSSLPDERLTAVAASGALRDRMRSAADRMLDDPKSRRFVADFTDQWLGLSELGRMPPDERKFAVYYRERLQRAMRRETREFFDYILRHDRPVDEFVTADYSFVNGALARHYGVPKPTGDDFERTSLDGHGRGGLLGHASILTLTSNGVETSPVTRGVWLLERILGTPPPPQPADAPALQPDIRGATTLREQFSKHRTHASCNACHETIDPLGFALESFDPIGRARRRYPNSLPIDTSGVLPNGEEFDDLAELKSLLARRPDQLIRCLTEKLLTYACGRRMGSRDRATIARIVEKVVRDGLGLRGLILEVVDSEVFKRN